MTDLIFHIGLSKCASSTLQQDVFCHEDGYLGTAPGIGRDENLAKQLQECTPFVGRQTTSKRGLRKWADNVRRLHETRWPEIDRLILSNEFLSAASRLSDRPILRVLSILKNQFWREGRIKVVLVLRNQAARMASGYVQNSNGLWVPGQLDFECTVKQRLNRRRYRRLLDYSRWVEGLERAIGSENVCILLLEDSRTQHFWEKLARFCQLEHFDPKTMMSDHEEGKNVRRKGHGRWSVRELDTTFRAKTVVDKWMNLVWPARLYPQSRGSIRERAIARVDAYYRWKAMEMASAGRETEIHLSERVMEIVRAYCGPGNTRLARQLGRNLDSLGY